VATQRQFSPEETKPVEAKPEPPRETKREDRRVLRTLGLGVSPKRADDDPSAIGTYASAGAAIGPSRDSTAAIFSATIGLVATWFM
jgi:hypothetical protein